MSTARKCSFIGAYTKLNSDRALPQLRYVQIDEGGYEAKMFVILLSGIIIPPQTLLQHRTYRGDDLLYQFVDLCPVPRDLEFVPHFFSFK
jgi:hypothetical protein